MNAIATLRRVPLLGICAATALVAVVVLAYELYRETHEHRESAEQMLGDCAMLAAGDYAHRLGSMLDMGVLGPARRTLLEAERSGHLPSRTAVRDAGPDQALMRRLARTFLHFDSGTGDLEFGDDVEVEDRAWMLEAVAHYAETLGPETYDVELLLLPRDEDFGLLLCRAPRTRDGFSGEVIGCLADWEAFKQIFGAILTASDPLVSALNDRSEGKAFTIRVFDPSGDEVFSSAPHPPDAIRRRTIMGARHAGLVIEAGLDPAWGPTLLRGGVPRPRAQEVLLLAAAALLPLFGAFRLLGRERELARIRSGFVASVSHELRTPLAQIRLFSETLLLGRVRSEGDERRSLEILDAEARRLENLVENVLQYSRVERQALSLRVEETDLLPVVRATTEQYRPLAAARDATIELRAEPASWCMADRSAVRTMLLNLLDNAVKHGPEGQAILVELVNLEGGVELSVTDDGQGVAPQHEVKIWQRFWRAPNCKDACTGAGIGLALVRELADLQDASVGVASSVSTAHRGARFVIRFRTAQAATEPEVDGSP